jgi:transketolase
MKSSVENKKPLYFSKGENSDPEIQIKELENIANQLRIEVVKIMGRFGSGHIGGSMSIVEMLSVLYFNEMNYNPEDTDWEDRDRFILSKGHACFTQYAALAMLGVLPREVLKHPYEIDSPMQGHPEYGTCPGVEVSTGALGQGLSVGVGMAIGAKIQKKDFRVYVVVGDGELNEGQIWEATMLASARKLNNLVAFIDKNRFSLTDSTEVVLASGAIDKKFEAFGWHVINIDGHSVREILDALKTAKNIQEKPVAIVAETIKGKGISFLENKAVSHSTALPRAEAEKVLQELGCSWEEITQAFI